MANRTQKELLKILRKNRRSLYKLRGVHYVDVGYKYKNDIRTEELALRIHVFNKHSKAILQSSFLPKRIDGLKTDVIISHPVKNSRSGMPFPVIAGGIDIGNIYSNERGTLGALFRDSSGRIAGLTNYHVLFANGGRINDPVSQPLFARPRPGDLIGRISGGDESLDCAVFRFESSRQADDAIVELTQAITMSAPAQFGQAVVKSGAATEITYGIVEGSDGIRYTVCANPGKPNNGNVISAVGDSGSIWMLDEPGTTTGVGLHATGTIDGSKALFYDLDRVMETLGIDFLNQ